MARPAVQRKPLCPQCGRSEAVFAIAYGSPDPVLERQADDVVVLADSVARDHAPGWFCRACDSAFGERDSAA